MLFQPCSFCILNPLCCCTCNLFKMWFNHFLELKRKLKAHLNLKNGNDMGEISCMQPCNPHRNCRYDTSRKGGSSSIQTFPLVETDLFYSPHFMKVPKLRHSRREGRYIFRRRKVINHKFSNFRGNCSIPASVMFGWYAALYKSKGYKLRTVLQGPSVTWNPI